MFRKEARDNFKVAYSQERDLWPHDSEILPSRNYFEFEFDFLPSYSAWMFPLVTCRTFYESETQWYARGTGVAMRITKPLKILVINKL
jgi:hypothetical protein